jgi:hypothetical protein
MYENNHFLLSKVKGQVKARFIGKLTKNDRKKLPKHQSTVSLCQCISSRYLSFSHDLSRSGISLWGASFFCGRLGFWLQRWHWCYHIWEELSQRSLQSLSWCAQSIGFGSSSYILSLCDGLSNWGLFLRRPANKRRSEKWQAPEVLFRSIPLPAKSASEKPTRSSEEEAEYQISNLRVCLRYQKIHWTAWRCEVCGEAWKRAHKHLVNWMSDCVAVRYKREPILLLYSLWLTASPSSMGSSVVVVLIGVDTGLASAKENFLIKSFVYLAWCTNVPFFVCLTWIPKKNVSSPIMYIWNSFSIIA